MCAFNQPPQPVGLDVRVDLRRCDIGMPEHLLHAAEISTVIEKMAGESVAQYMRRESRWVDASPDRELLQ
jgi:hypothetical protein